MGEQEIFARDSGRRHGENRENAVRYLVECIHCRIDDLALDGASLPSGYRPDLPPNLFPSRSKGGNKKLELQRLLNKAASGGRLSCAGATLLAEQASLGPRHLCFRLCREAPQKESDSSYQNIASYGSLTSAPSNPRSAHFSLSLSKRSVPTHRQQALHKFNNRQSGNRSTF